MEHKTIECECGSCDGTGIYHGFAEPSGVGVICLYCKGSGKSEITYKPFTERHKRHDINTVQLSRGGYIVTGVGPRGKSVTYDEFLAGKIPTEEYGSGRGSGY